MPFPLDEKWIRAAEEALGKSLPDDYKGRLIRDNGGELEAEGDIWFLHPILDQSDRKRVKRTCNHILLETKNANEWPGFPPEAVAIATNGSGDIMVFLPDENTEAAFGSRAYAWWHETRQLQCISEFRDLIT